MVFKKKTIILAGTACILAACTPTVNQHGNMLTDLQISRVETGVSTQSDVLRLLGSPTTRAPFNEEIWYYIGQETEKRGILDPEVTDERVVAVAFSPEGIVEDIRDIDNERLNIPVERDATKTHGNDLTVLQQFLGNLGRFNPQEQ